MFNHAIENTAPEALTEEQLELVSGGFTVGVYGQDGDPTCPPLPVRVLPDQGTALNNRR